MPPKQKADTAGYQQLKKDLAGGEPGRLYLFHGEETYLRDHYLAQLKEQLLSGGMGEFNLHELSAKEMSPRALEEAVERSVGKPAAAFGLVEGARVAVAGALSRGRRTLIVAPPHIGENLPDTGLIENFGVQAIETSHGFAKEFLKISRIQKADFLDAAQFCAPSQRDAVHLTAQGHLALAESLAAKVRAMLAEQ